MADRFPLYRSSWEQASEVVADLRAVADYIEQSSDTEWYIQPVDSDGGDFEWDDDNAPDNYVLTHL